jgi:hypothetical protein
MAKGDRWSDDRDVKVREMRNAETVLGVIREREFEAETTGELLEIERLTSSLEGGRWKSAIGNSLAAYPTARPVWSGGKTVRSYLSLPGK